MLPLVSLLLGQCSECHTHQAKGADIDKLGGSVKGCKTICHRFGFGSLAAADAAFEGITHPNPCTVKCDEVFNKFPMNTAFLMRERAHAAAGQAKKDLGKLGGSAKGCKTICQRFGFGSLAAADAAFKGITHPTPCTVKCDEVFSKFPTQTSLLMRNREHAAITQGRKQGCREATS